MNNNVRMTKPTPLVMSRFHWAFLSLVHTTHLISSHLIWAEQQSGTCPVQFRLSVCASVCLSVCHTRALYQNG